MSVTVRFSRWCLQRMATSPLGPNRFRALPFSGLTGPASFGPGGGFSASSGTGTGFALEASNNGFGFPILLLHGTLQPGFVWMASDTYDNTTIAALGLTPGTYTWTWGTGPHADSFTINIAGVPEPCASLMMVRHRRGTARRLGCLSPSAREGLTGTYLV